jgi:NADPH-dependent 2,4-dienoyl-CoA reductase/sulfur reductase-like enzyme/nitrite reductase/ring-hydroxylating ferredoxin subunit
MGQGASELKGPDLAAGVPLAELADGAMLLGHAGGEPVLVARRGDECFAIGATCTHYGGPLAEGLFVEDTVRCPLHHACFNLRTGEAVRAPAFHPVPCWKVETRDGRVRVTEKLALPRPAQVSEPSSVVIVGGGAAAHAAAEMLRRRGYVGRVLMLSADAAGPVDRPNLSKDYLAGTAPEEWIPLAGPEFYAERGIEVRVGVPVAALDTANKRVHLADGASYEYGALLIAMGAEANRLRVPGADLPHVFTLRTLADSRAIIARAASSKRAVVAGASFIGLEVAASLRARGLEVHVVAPEARPLERVLGPELGDFVRALHESHGVIFHLGQTPSAIDGHAVTLSGGALLAADLVVAGVGVRPAVELAERAGISVDNGIIVDEFLRTSASDVYAAGDLARWPDPYSGEYIRVEHWVVATRQGQTAARNLLGAHERFREVPFFWSQHYEVPILYVGHASRWDQLEVHGELAARDATVVFRAGGKVRAVATVGRDRASLLAEQALASGQEPPVA